MNKRSSRDLLSDLPLSIIHCILERVPIRDAVKTSILSRQWRYKWATLPHLVFNDKCVTPSGDDEIDEVRLKDFINEALLLHKGPIHKFKLDVSYIKSYYVDRWLLFLSRNDIRMLILEIRSSDHRVCIHSSLYSCQNLTHLELWSCKIPPPPPTFKGFLCLKCLVLQIVYSPSDRIESLVANSPLLEELTLHCSIILELKIRAPNLKNLSLNYVYNDICLYAPLLAKMQVSAFLDLPKGGLQQKTSACNYTNFLGGFTSLEELSGDSYFIEFLSIGFESCQRSLVFHHLRVIELFDVNFYDVKVVSVAVRLISGAPNLHRLKIKIDQSYFNQPSASDSFAPNFTFERLKVIEMKKVRGGLDEMKFIKFLLASSPVLETMIFKPSSCVDAEQQQLTLTAELLRYRRASSNAEILFHKR